MNYICRKTTLFLFLFFTSPLVFAQIGWSQAEVVENFGDQYEVGTTDDGMSYIKYDTEQYSRRSGTYVRTKVIYFFENSDGNEVCHLWKTFDPYSETNMVVSNIQQNKAKINHRTWKDYGENTVYEVAVKSGYCVVTAWYDFNNDL
ncbi:hypothetical protein [Luteirhabdus pelagi]|uniref:hypothetical protein n=1 Tax=Luteirhabdus pelagi TaxID=2792783 RepID=UPI00193A8A45|nr:hypothetical protein [Luteirhabdus pelagi]